MHGVCSTTKLAGKLRPIILSPELPKSSQCGCNGKGLSLLGRKYDIVSSLSLRFSDRCSTVMVETGNRAWYNEPCVRQKGKRSNLANVQSSSIIPCKGYMASPYSTGYDRVLGSRVGKEYAFVAQDNGVVKKLTDDRLIIEYANGDVDGVKIGIWHGEVAGEYVSHTMVTDLTGLPKFKKGDILAWNQDFFERDFLSKTNVVMKLGALAFVSLCEGNDTLEDGCAIDTTLAKLTTTSISKRKTFLLDFTEEIELLKDIGDEIEYSDVLCRISNYIEGSDNTDASIEALEKFSGSNPKAGHSGKITGIELIYMGDKDNMSPKLKALADRFDKLMLKDKRDFGGARASTCQVSNPVFFGGERLVENTLAISFYIDADADAGIGDKLVFGNQLKSIIGRVMTGTNETESGITLNARFGIRSVFARIVGSGFIVGGYNRILHHGSMEFVRLAEGG